MVRKIWVDYTYKKQNGNSCRLDKLQKKRMYVTGAMTIKDF